MSINALIAQGGTPIGADLPQIANMLQQRQQQQFQNNRLTQQDQFAATQRQQEQTQFAQEQQDRDAKQAYGESMQLIQTPNDKLGAAIQALPHVAAAVKQAGIDPNDPAHTDALRAVVTQVNQAAAGHLGIQPVKPLQTIGDLNNPNAGVYQQEPITGALTVIRQPRDPIEQQKLSVALGALQERARHDRVAEATANPFGNFMGAGGPTGAAPTGAPASTAGAMAPTAAPTPGLPGVEKLGAGGNQAFLQKLPPQIQSTVKAIAEGRMQVPSGMALKTPYWQQMMAAVSQYDPSFDGINFNSRAKTRNDFTSGKDAATINKLNTAIGHAGQLDSQIGGTAGHGGFPGATLLNAAQNAISSSSGNPGVPLFKDTAGKLSQELTAVYRGGGGAEKDVVRGLESLDPNASTETKKAILKNAVDLLDSKLGALGDQYNQGMGLSEQPFRLLNPHAQAVYQRLLGASGAPSAAPTNAAPAKTVNFSDLP